MYHRHYPSSTAQDTLPAHHPEIYHSRADEILSVCQGGKKFKTYLYAVDSSHPLPTVGFKVLYLAQNTFRCRMKQITTTAAGQCDLTHHNIINHCDIIQNNNKRWKVTYCNSMLVAIVALKWRNSGARLSE